MTLNGDANREGALGAASTSLRDARSLRTGSEYCARALLTGRVEKRRPPPSRRLRAPRQIALYTRLHHPREEEEEGAKQTVVGKNGRRAVGGVNEA